MIRQDGQVLVVVGGIHSKRIYIDSERCLYGASATDQRGSKLTDGRTVNGKPVEYVGRISGEMSYAEAVECNEAATRAAIREQEIIWETETIDGVKKCVKFVEQLKDGKWMAIDEDGNQCVVLYSLCNPLR